MTTPTELLNSSTEQQTQVEVPYGGKVRITVVTPPKTAKSASRTDDDEESRISSQSSPNRLPEIFYCPLTGVLMKDPVVSPNGMTCDRSAYDPNNTTFQVYRNRVIQACIEQQVEQRQQTTQNTDDKSTVNRSGSSLWNSSRKTTSSGARTSRKSIRGSLRGLGKRMSRAFDTRRPLPDALYCPITQDLFIDPVIDPEGNSFEREAILKWIKEKKSSPVTRTPLSPHQLYDNIIVIILLGKESNKSPNGVHPSIRRWRKEIFSRQHSQLRSASRVVPDQTARLANLTAEIMEAQNRREVQRRDLDAAREARAAAESHANTTTTAGSPHPEENRYGPHRRHPEDIDVGRRLFSFMCGFIVFFIVFGVIIAII